MPACISRCFSLATLLMVCIGAWPGTVVGQAGQGRIAGRLSDAQTGEELIGATVIIVGTSTGSQTDVEGKFSFAAPTGTHTLELRYIGYTTRRLEGVIVQAAEPTLLTLTLSANTKELEEVVITTQASQNTEGSLLQDQRQAAGVSSGVSAELLARTPDRSMAESLRRVSGASVRDGRFAVVRGLQERYNQGQINGMAQPSTEPDRKAFALDLFPTALVDRIIVYKTGTPDLPGDFAGGVVRVNTVDIPYANTTSLTVGAEANTITTGKTFLQSHPGKTDFLGFDDGTRALPRGISSAEQSQIDPGLQRQARQNRVQNNDFSPTRTAAAGPNLYLQAFFGRRGTLFGRQGGIVAGLNYYRTLQYSDFLNFNNNTEILDSTTGRRRIVDYDSAAQRRYRTSASASAILNMALRPSATSKVSFRNMLVQNGSDLYIQALGKSVSGAGSQLSEGQAYTTFYEQNRLLTQQLSYEKIIGTEGGKVELLAGTSFQRRSTPDYKRLNYGRSGQPGQDLDQQPFTAILAAVQNNFSPSYSTKFYSTLREDAFNPTANVWVPVRLVGLKHMLRAGGFFQSRDRTYQGRNFNYANSLIGPAFPGLDSITQLGPGEIFSPKNLGGGLFYLRETTRASDFYRAQSQLTAGYLMSETSLGRYSRLIYGLRVERYRQSLKTAQLNGVNINSITTVTDLLPSINAQIGFTERLTLRAAYFLSVNRPEFREIAPAIFYDAYLNAVVFGNDTLKRAQIQNFDLKLEYYPTDGAVLSINGFAKLLDSPIEQSRVNVSGAPTFTFLNAGKASIQGVEVEARSTLGFLAAAAGRENSTLKNLTLFANGALIQSIVRIPSVEKLKRPLQGQSPFTLNAGASYLYTKLALEGALNISRTGTRLAFVGDSYASSIWERPRTILDGSITYRRKRLITKLVVGDLLAQDQIFFILNTPNLTLYNRRDFLGTPIYKGGQDIPFYKYTYGRTIRLMLTYNL